MDAKLHQGTAAWFDMVGQAMCEAALQANLAPGPNLTLIERYTDGVEIAEGLSKASDSTLSTASHHSEAEFAATNRRTS